MGENLFFKMPFKKLIWFMFSMVKESSQNALDRELFQASVRGSYNETMKD
jgi:hypothetical protein